MLRKQFIIFMVILLLIIPTAVCAETKTEDSQKTASQESDDMEIDIDEFFDAYLESIEQLGICHYRHEVTFMEDGKILYEKTVVENKLNSILGISFVQAEATKSELYDEDYQIEEDDEYYYYVMTKTFADEETLLEILDMFLDVDEVVFNDKEIGLIAKTKTFAVPSEEGIEEIDLLTKSIVEEIIIHSPYPITETTAQEISQDKKTVGWRFSAEEELPIGIVAEKKTGLSLVSIVTIIVILAVVGGLIVQVIVKKNRNNNTDYDDYDYYMR